MSPPPGSALVRVMLVDDSAVIRSVLRRILEEDPTIEIVATARNGQEAIDRASQKPMDVILLDVEMPVMDGLTAIPHLRRVRPEANIIMSSSLTQEGAGTTMKALSLGAVDYFAKPTSGNQAEGIAALGAELRRRVVACGSGGKTVSPTGSVAVRAPRSTERSDHQWRGRARLLLIASSTGGPQALDSFLGSLDRSVRTPILIAQHMPPVFTGHLAQQLERASSKPCREAVDGEPILDGQILVAPGDFHLSVVRKGDRLFTALGKGERENFVRPAADVLFRTAVDCCGGDLVAVILTGMGEDGKRGAVQVHEAGGLVMIQDRDSSVVWGMPGAVHRTGVAAAELPLPQLAEATARACRQRVLG